MRVWLVALVVSLALAGCGDKKDTGIDGTEYETPAKEGNVYVITLTSDNAFDPTSAKVPAGSFIEWRIENSGCTLKSADGSIDASDHATVDGNRYNNGNLPKGAAWRWDSTGHSGEIEYRCSGKDIHGVLKLTGS